MMSYGAKGKAKSLGRKSIKCRGRGFCARQNAQAGVRTHLRWQRSQTYCNTSLIHRLLGIHVKSLNSSSFLAHTCGFFFSFFFSTVFFTGTHLECSCVKFLVSTRASLVVLGFIWRPQNHLQLFAVNAMRARILRSSGFTLFYVCTNWNPSLVLASGVPGAVKRSRYCRCRAPSTPWCQTLFFFCFLHPLHHSSSSCPRPSLPPSSGIHQATREGGEEPINC